MFLLMNVFSYIQYVFHRIYMMIGSHFFVPVLQIAIYVGFYIWYCINLIQNLQLHQKLQEAKIHNRNVDQNQSDRKCLFSNSREAICALQSVVPIISMTVVIHVSKKSWDDQLFWRAISVILATLGLVSVLDMHRRQLEKIVHLDKFRFAHACRVIVLVTVGLVIIHCL